MVEKHTALYLFLGRDSQSKDLKLNKIKEEVLASQAREFDLDVLYARELTLRGFQEKILLLPLRAERRLIVIRQAQHLKEELKKFILANLKKILREVVLVLDADIFDRRNEFFNSLSKIGQAYYFGFESKEDAFSLSRQIEGRKTATALRILAELLAKGEKPERIMGGLRYSWEKSALDPAQSKKRLRALLNCDLEIKRGRLKPELALEKLIIGLCALQAPRR
ncbi:MAG: hypothetical protein PHS09_03125 [Candidatus Omnitrophica bacterium]|nr:hypothetical protein [Candidatus Omnitrophota bacterium]MDD5512782.1 hypothetical protein [Candidatus Omnitrophota bacterium]